MRVMLRILVVALCVLMPVRAALAQMPAGTAPCGIPMFIFASGMGGMSTVYNNQPVITIDPQIANGDSSMRTFTIWHECGHHVNGDTLPSGMASRWAMSAIQEMNADCYAAEHVPKPVSVRVANYFSASQGNYAPAPGYPTGNMRAQNIRRCAGLVAHSEDGAVDACPGLPLGMSLLCRFTTGPRAGDVHDFCGSGARPARKGTACTDGMGSWGIAQ